eukprot:3054935-Rhodomonas_salina.1
MGAALTSMLIGVRSEADKGCAGLKGKLDSALVPKPTGKEMWQVRKREARDSQGGRGSGRTGREGREGTERRER